jgi:hypothetical protein
MYCGSSSWVKGVERLCWNGNTGEFIRKPDNTSFVLKHENRLILQNSVSICLIQEVKTIKTVRLRVSSDPPRPWRRTNASSWRTCNPNQSRSDASSALSVVPTTQVRKAFVTAVPTGSAKSHWQRTLMATMGGGSRESGSDVKKGVLPPLLLLALALAPRRSFWPPEALRNPI